MKWPAAVTAVVVDHERAEGIADFATGERAAVVGGDCFRRSDLDGHSYSEGEQIAGPNSSGSYTLNEPRKPRAA